QGLCLVRHKPLSIVCPSWPRTGFEELDLGRPVQPVPGSGINSEEYPAGLRPTAIPRLASRLYYFAQFSTLIFCKRKKCVSLLVTRTILFSMAVAPIKRSKSSTIFPSFLSLAFSFA